MTAKRGSIGRSPWPPLDTNSANFTRQSKIDDPLVLGALGFPVARLGLSVALELALALDRVAAQFPLVRCRELLALPLAGHLEGDLPVLVLGILDGGLLVVATDNHPG